MGVASTWFRLDRSRRDDVGEAGSSRIRATAVRRAGYLRGHRLSVVLSVAAFFASAAIDPLLPALLKDLLDNGFKAKSGFPVEWVPPVIVGLFALRGALNFAGSYLSARSVSYGVLSLRRDLVGS